ncbi:hypothetical protein [Streptomyces sp. cg36]|uniref:hypothetical protein n=1 Tax=Streptomyces sp. cg36 TaxID=3238798 RepID=UPI0034E1F552
METINKGGRMADGLWFSWVLSGSGWATCLIRDGSSQRRDVVSYCTDALADLLHSVAGLYGPGCVERFSFDLEPAEVRWVLRGRGADVHIAVRHFPDMSASFDAPDREAALVWSSTQPRRLLAHVVAEAAGAVLRTHGEEGYRARWVQHPFPSAALHDLYRLHLQHDSCALAHDLPGKA